jgi:hypothetical protein
VKTGIDMVFSAPSAVFLCVLCVPVFFNAETAEEGNAETGKRESKSN